MTAYECSVENHEKVRWRCAVTINNARSGYDATCNAEKALDAALHKSDPDIAAAFDWAFRKCIARQRSVHVQLSDQFCGSRNCTNGLHVSTCTPADGCDNFVVVRCAGVRSEYSCVYKMTPQRALVAQIERGNTTAAATFAATALLMPVRPAAQQHRRGTLAPEDQPATTASAAGPKCFFVSTAGCNPCAKPFTPKGSSPDSDHAEPANAAAAMGTHNQYVVPPNFIGELDDEIRLRAGSGDSLGTPRAIAAQRAASTTPPGQVAFGGPPRTLSTEEQRWLLSCLQHNTSGTS